MREQGVTHTPTCVASYDYNINLNGDMMVKSTKQLVVLNMGGKLVHRAKHTPASAKKFITKARALGKEGAKGVIHIYSPDGKTKRTVRF